MGEGVMFVYWLLNAPATLEGGSERASEKGREKQTETERKTDGQTETGKKTETERQKDRDRETKGQRQRQRDRVTETKHRDRDKRSTPIKSADKVRPELQGLWYDHHRTESLRSQTISTQLPTKTDEPRATGRLV